MVRHGRTRIEVHLNAPPAVGTTAHTDTHQGRFVRLVPDEQVVETVEFETDDPGMRGEMTITITLKRSTVRAGTDLTAVRENLPSAISREDNETGWRSSLGKLAALVESR